MIGISTTVKVYSSFNPSIGSSSSLSSDNSRPIAHSSSELGFNAIQPPLNEKSPSSPISKSSSAKIKNSRSYSPSTRRNQQSDNQTPLPAGSFSSASSLTSGKPDISSNTFNTTVKEFTSSNTGLDFFSFEPSSASAVLVTPLTEVPSHTIVSNCGRVDLFLIREETTLKDNNDLSFISACVMDLITIARANCAFQNCNALLSLRVNLMDVNYNAGKKQIYIVLSLSGDACRIVKNPV